MSPFEKTKKRFSLVDYDGINLFYKSKWTKIEVGSVDNGRNIIGFLDTLNDEQAEHWIRLQLYLKDTTQTWNTLKHDVYGRKV